MSKKKRNILQFLYDLEYTISNIKNYMTGVSYEEFTENELLIGYIERQLEKIGEAIGQIQKIDSDFLLEAKLDKKYWENIKGVRNRLIHEYWGTSLEMIYEISTDELDELLEYCLTLQGKAIWENSFFLMKIFVMVILYQLKIRYTKLRKVEWQEKIKNWRRRRCIKILLKL